MIMMSMKKNDQADVIQMMNKKKKCNYDNRKEDITIASKLHHSIFSH